MMRVRQLRDGRVRLTLWHHIEPCPDDEERFDLILYQQAMDRAA